MYRCESWTIKKAECRTDAFELVLEKILESPLDYKEMKPILKEVKSWIFIGRTDAEAEIPIFWPPDVKNWLIGRLWCWARLKAGGEGDSWRWDGWMASLIQWTWVCVSSGSWWWTGRPRMLQSMGLQRVGHDWDWTELKSLYQFFFSPELSFCHPNFSHSL